MLQSRALAVLKDPYAGHLFPGNRSNFNDYESLWYYTCTKKVPPHFDKTPSSFVDVLSR